MNAASANDMNESVILNDNMSDVLSVSDENRLLEGSKTFTNLNEDINNNQDSEVNLNSDYFFNSDSDTSFRNGISISRNLTVNGNGHTLDGKNSASIFRVTSNNINVVLKNLILVNGNNKNGGAISGNCIAQNCTFINNTATDFGGAIYRGSAVECNFYNNTANEGGAVYIDKKNVNILNCIFENNAANERGGAISLDSSVYTVVENCTFKKNRAKTGGAMNVVYTKFLSLSNSTFIDNVATLDGGGVYYDFAIDNILDNCYFENNQAMRQNGGAFAWIFSNGNITNNKFKHNSAAGNGGAIYINLEDLEYLVNNQLLLNCSFTDNHAKNGGAIYNDDYYVIGEITSTFINNSASRNGGAVYCKDGCDLSFSNFIANSAGGDGGAVYCNNKAMFFNSIFIGNSAKSNGGAIYCNDECGFFGDEFINNSAQIGGSLYCNNSCSIYKSEFSNNSAYDAGAIYSKDMNTFYNLKFNNNSASNHAGAVYCGVGNKFYVSNFINNSASLGPAVYTLDAHNTFKNSIFLLNKANFLSKKVNNEYLTLTFDIGETFLNAIHSWFILDYENVTYWNGTITNTDIAPPIEGCPGIIFTIEIYDSNNQLIRKFNQQTNDQGQLVLDYSDLEVGDYTCKLYHEDDDYYCEYSQIIKLTVGEFSKLQYLLHYADENSTINLTRNYTYSIGFDTLKSLNFEHKNLSINGNGYTINALNHPCELFGFKLNSISVYNCSFINNIVLNLRQVDNVYISDCNFTNGSLAIQCIESDICEVVGCNFVNNSNFYGGACDFQKNKNLIIKNSNFTNNRAYNGGAISIDENNLNSISNCIFVNNTAQESGGVIYSINSAIDLLASAFFNNSARSGGVAYLMKGGSTVDNCTFVNNYADRGSAAYSYLADIVLKNSIFLNNKALSVINSDISEDLKITIDLSGGNNFINAINAFNIVCENVTYWNGAITNTDVVTPVKGCPGQNITVLIYDEEDNLIANVTEKTDENGRFVYDILNAPQHSFRFVFYHENDAYYNESSSVEFNSSLSKDFEILQFLINNANENSIINLARNYTFDSAVNGALVFDKNNVTLNGNGYVINALSQSLTVHVDAENVTLRNVTFINGESTIINIWPSALNCVIDNANFISNNLGDNEVINVNSDNTTIKNTNFINITGIAIGLVDCGNITIFNCSFINNTNAILSTGMDSILISECNFVNNSNHDSAYGTISLKCDVATISLSNFTNNIASVGGAVYLEGNITNISNCIFNGNIADRGGAMFARVKQANITYCSFLNNSANEYGGALYLLISEEGIVDNSIFRLNSADEGAAIYWGGPNNILKNSELLDNKANSKELSLESTDGCIVIKFAGKNNYINAIQSVIDFEMENVVYWNGDIVNSDDVSSVENQCSGQAITLEIYDSKFELVANITLLTDGENNICYNISDLDEGNYSFKAYHLDDKYYSYIGGVNGNFTLNRPSSSVNIEFINKSEFNYSNCNISFNVVNKTDLRVVITDISGNHVYINQTIDENYIIVDLDPNEDYYNITVYNLGNLNYSGSQDSKLFKILKLNSSIAFNPISDMIYNNESLIIFDGENLTTVNVTIYDGDKNIVFENTTSNRYVVLPVLPVGTYNITLINNGDAHFNKCINSTSFNIVKASNEVIVSVDDVIYGNQALISIFAEVDGNYALHVQGIGINITVTKGKGKTKLSLPVGNYYAKVTFDNPNYNSLITNAAFNVLKASNLVYVLADDVVYGNSTVVAIFAQVDGNYTLNVNGKLRNVSVVDGEGKIWLNLSYGVYYANVTFSHPYYDSEIINTTFYVLEFSDFNVSYYVDLDTGDVIFNITVCNEATGNVTVQFGNENYSAIINNGSATVRVPHPKFGDYDVVIKYNGDDNYLKETENVNVHIKKAIIDAKFMMIMES